MDETNPTTPTTQTQPATYPTVSSGPQGVQSGPPQTPQPLTTPTTPSASGPGVIPTDASMPKKSPFFSFWLWGPLIFILNAAAIYWFLVYPRMGNLINIPTNQQILTREIQVNEVTVKEYAALVIERPDRVGIGSTIAETGMLWPGTYRNFSMRLIVDEALLDEELLREVPPGLVYATLYKDVDGDLFYNADVDKEPVRDLFGNPVRVEFVIQ